MEAVAHTHQDDEIDTKSTFPRGRPLRWRPMPPRPQREEDTPDGLKRVSSETVFFEDWQERHPKERAWLAYLERVEGRDFTAPQTKTARRLWDALTTRFGASLVPPQAIAGEGNSLELSWNLEDLTACVEIAEDGTCYWWTNRVGTSEYNEGRNDVVRSLGDALDSALA